jgi:protoporphyrinogen oxidase
MKETAIIIGAGPAGLTAAYELIAKTDIQPIIIEKSDMVGGISKTVDYKGNRLDIGGHRFFSKSKVVMDWWLNILPAQSQNQLSHDDKVMLIRNRHSRIFFLGNFFDYPIRFNRNLMAKLGLTRMVRIGCSYLKVKLMPIQRENSLEAFFINRFGKELYLTFFKDYTEKVWGVPCTRISPEWGAQRVKNLSVFKTVLHAIGKPFKKRQTISQEGVETSLIERFMYPKYGPGQMWETVAEIIEKHGGIILRNSTVVSVGLNEGKVMKVEIEGVDRERQRIKGDYFFSTMPVSELVQAMGAVVPEPVREVANGLMYRDFITVGLLAKRLLIHNPDNSGLIPDQWIYIQDSGVKLGRLQIFNNWSPSMVANPDNVWIGLEYFCNQGDDIWEMNDEAMIKFAVEELHKLQIIDRAEVIDATMVRMPKAYPAYFGTYPDFRVIREYVDSIENLFLIGRNGMHKYNNQDHSMLTAIMAVDNIISQVKSKDNIWSVNTEEAYHES